MNYPESLDYLYGLQLFGIKLGLDNIRVLLQRLGDPQRQFACVHVAGTNGKGSVCLLLSEMLRHSGLRVGLYTSPHLHDFNERVRIGGCPIENAEVARLAEEIRAAAAGLPVTFFEATTALAMLAFARQGVDVAVIETGMGGRLDATNVVLPILTCITPISLDHQEYLGDSLVAIAAEKAGIIKPGVPVVSGRQPAEVASVLSRSAQHLAAPLVVADRDYTWHGTASALAFAGAGLELDGLRLALRGAHQLDNCAQALAAVQLLRQQGWDIPVAAMRLALVSATWPGRLEWWPGAGVLLDAAHNRAGATCLAAYLEQQGDEKVHLVAGLTGQRHPALVLEPLVPYAQALYAVPVPDAITVAPAELTAWAVEQGLVAQSCASPQAGLAAALAARQPDQMILVCGSLYLVAVVRAMLLADKNLTDFQAHNVA